MIAVKVVDQDERRVVIEGTVSGYPQLTQRWTVGASALAQNPDLLAQARDELLAKLQTNLTNWQAVQVAIGKM